MSIADPPSNWTTISGLSELESCTSLKDEDSFTTDSSFDLEKHLDKRLTRTETPFDINRYNSRNNHSAHSREALERKLQLLEYSKRELMSTSDAKSNAYEIKIKSLENTINQLRNKNMVT
jgi:SMC interacting uncharacterized protein involved in chromosome segregation